MCLLRCCAAVGDALHPTRATQLGRVRFLPPRREGSPAMPPEACIHATGVPQPQAGKWLSTPVVSSLRSGQATRCDVRAFCSCCFAASSPHAPLSRAPGCRTDDAPRATRATLHTPCLSTGCTLPGALGPALGTAWSWFSTIGVLWPVASELNAWGLLHTRLWFADRLILQPFGANSGKLLGSERMSRNVC